MKQSNKEWNIESKESGLLEEAKYQILDDWNEERTKLIELLTKEHQYRIDSENDRYEDGHLEEVCSLCQYLEELGE